MARKKSRHGPPVTLKIPRELYNTLSKKIEETGFRSVTELAVYVLRDVAAAGVPQRTTDLTSKEVEAIRTRLRSLGYID